MELIGWMYDIAREQSPRPGQLGQMLRRSGSAGYNAVGLYLEHRFAYDSAPWAAAPGCLTPDAVRGLIHGSGSGPDASLPRLIPFLNTLGHMEGFIRSQGGQWLAEGECGFGGEQMCASRRECIEFARGLVADAIDAFDDQWVHLGGDETRQLGQCPACAERVAKLGKGGLYAEYFAPLCRFVLERGRRPCLWGDMLLQYPDALETIPRETIIFDWQYFSRPLASARAFRERGFDVVCCPSIQTYNAGWCFLADSQRNIDEHAEDARAAGALGVLITTWELSCFTSYAAILPLVFAAGRHLSRGEPWPAALVAEAGERHAQAAEILGNRIPATSGFLRPGTWRSLRDSLVIRQNPFYLWSAWREEACGPVGDEIRRLCAEAMSLLPDDDALRGAIELHQVAVDWVRAVQRACRAYAEGELVRCDQALAAGQAQLERLRPGLEQVAAQGGSVADVARLELLVRKVVQARERVRRLEPGGGYRPAFETLVHDAYVAGDQAAWRTRAYV